MNPLDERMEHMILDRFTYADRSDDGYGPEHPRVGDTGWLNRPAGRWVAGTSFPFEVARDPRTGLPALRVFYDNQSDPRRVMPNMDAKTDWESLLCTVFDDAELILVRRGHGEATRLDDGLITLQPPYEGTRLLREDGGMLLDADTDHVVETIGQEDVYGTLIRLGYEYEDAYGEDAE